MRVETIKDGRGLTMATIVAGRKLTPGIEFPTDRAAELQVGVMSWPPGHVIKAHYHQAQLRNNVQTTEVILVRAGSAELRLYDTHPKVRLVAARIIFPDWVVVIHGGGHELVVGPDGFDAVEVKQGPFDSARDKIRFNPTELWGQIDKA